MLLLNKGTIGKVSLFSIIFLAVIISLILVLPAFAVLNPGNVTFVTPANNAYQRGTITVNVTSNSSDNINASFYFINTTSTYLIGTNTTSGASKICTISWNTALTPDGVYNVTANVTNKTDWSYNVTVTNTNITIDNTNPVITDVRPINGGWIKNPSSVLFQVNLTEQNINTSVNVTVYYRKKGSTTWEVPASLKCYGNAPSYICNTTKDVSPWILNTDILEYLFNTTDLAGNTGSNGTEGSTLTATADTVKPAWPSNTTNPSSPTSYSQGAGYQFNVTWTDSLSGVSTVLIEQNFTTLSTTLQNVSMTQGKAVTNGYEYYYNISDLPVGTYVWRSYANDSAGNMNSTDQWTYTVAQATPILSLIISPTNSATYPTTTTATGSVTTGDHVGTYNISLYRNNTIFNSSTSLSSVTETITLGVAVYNYTLVYNGTQNYTTSSIANWTNISKGTPTLTLTNSSVTYPTFTTINGTVTTGDPVGSYNISLYRNNTLFNSTTSTSFTFENITLGAGIWNYTLVYNGTQNYTTSSITNWTNISKGTPALNLTNASGTYPTLTTINGTVKTGDTVGSYNISLYRNNTLFNSTTSTSFTFENITLGAGIWNYTIVYNGSANYTSTSLTNYTNISKGTPTLTLTNSSVTYPTFTTINGTVTTGDPAGSYNTSLYRNNTLYNSTTSTSFTFENITLGAGIWNYTLVYNGTQNYTTSSITNWTNISIGTLNVGVFVNDNNTNQTVVYPNTSTIKGNSSSSGVLPSFNLYVLNATSSALVYNNTSQSSPVFLSSLLLGNGTYNIIFNSTTNTNWTTATNNTLYLFVNKGNLSLSLSSLPVTYPNNTVATASETNIGDADVNYTLYLNTSGLVNNSSTLGNGNISQNISLGAGSYLYTLNTTSGTFANYTANTTGVNATVTVSQGATNLSLSITPSTTVTNPTATNASGSGCPTQGASNVNCTLWRNNTYITSAIANDSFEAVTLDTGTWNYNYSTSGNVNWTSNSTTTTLTVNAASFVPSGGGGGPVAPTTTITVTLKIGNANITIPSISAGNTVNVTIAKTEDVAFRQLNISAANSINNIKIVIIKLAGLPASATHSIQGNVYNYIEVDKTNFADSDLSNVFINFAVNKTWLTDNGVDKTNISLYRWSNDRWNELTTTYVSEDSSEVFYQAESPGFSYFLIGTKTPVPAPTTCTENWSCIGWSDCVNGKQTRTCTDANSCGTTVNKPAESQSCVVKEEVKTDNTWMYYSVVEIIIIVIALIILISSRKKKDLGQNVPSVPSNANPSVGSKI